MNKIQQYINSASVEAVRYHSEIVEVATGAARIQREETRRHAVEVCKQMCPSKVSRGCANLLHRRETKTTRCDGNCARVRFFINGLDRQEL